MEKFFSYIKRNYNHSEYKYCFVEKTKIRSDKIRKCIDEASIKNKFDDKTDDDADGDMGISMLNVDTASIDVV